MRTFPTVRQYCAYLEKNGSPLPVELREGRRGTTSGDYLLEIKPDALVFVAELAYGSHPAETSMKDTGQDVRRLYLRINADNKFLASAILEEWDRVKGDLDQKSPLYRKIEHDLVQARDTLHEGLTPWYEQPIKSLLFNPSYAKTATERDRLVAFMGEWRFVSNAYSFVRLLKESKKTDSVQIAIARLERIFDETIGELRKNIDFDRFEVIDCDRLVRGQLGSGFIALNSLLERRNSLQ
jgi:hypothetical protein